MELMTLETVRLVLRLIRENDAPALHRIMNDPEVTHNLLFPYPLSEEQLAIWIKSSIEGFSSREKYPMVIVLRESNEVIGVCAFYRVNWEHMNAELVYWLGKQHWGKGYMTEAVRRMLVFGFEELGFERIYAGCFTRNLASRRVLEKVGFLYEGLARHEFKKGDEFLDVFHFGLTRSEFFKEKYKTRV